MIILKVFSKNREQWKVLTELLGEDPILNPVFQKRNPKVKKKPANKKQTPPPGGRYKDNSNAQVVTDEETLKELKRNSEKAGSWGEKNTPPPPKNTPPKNYETATPSGGRRKPIEIWKPSKRQLKNAALIAAAAGGTAVGGKFLYDKYKDYEQHKLIENYRKRFES